MNQNLRRFIILFGIIMSLIMTFILYNFVGAITLGIFIYYATRPIYKRLVNRGVNKSISAALSPIIFIIPIFILVLYTIRIITVEARAIVIQTGGSIFSFIDEEQFEEILKNNEELSILLPQIESVEQLTIENILSIIQNVDSNVFESVIDSGLQFGLAAFSSLSGIFFTLLIAFSLCFYLLRDGHILREKLYSITNYDKHMTKYCQVLDKDLEVVFFGNILLAIFTGVLGVISFTLITVLVPGGNILAYPALIGVLCGITSLIPVIGMKLVYWPVTAIIMAIGLIESGVSGLLFPIVFFIVGFIIVDTIPDFIARPYISSRGGIATSVIFFSYIFGPLTFGWYGLFLGPLIFVIVYEFINIFLPKITRDISI